MLYSVETDTPVESIKSTIEERAKEYKFGLLKDYNFKEILELKNLPIENEIHVFELCFAPLAQQVLQSMPQMSVYLPCRISIFEKNDKTVMTTISMDEIVSNFDLPKEFKDEMVIVYERLQQLMKSF